MSQSNFVSSPYVAGDCTQISTSVSVEGKSVQIIGPNPLRKAFMLYNTSSKQAYVTYGLTASPTYCSFVLGPNESYAHTMPYIYIGPLTAMRDNGSGPILVTEFL